MHIHAHTCTLFVFSFLLLDTSTHVFSLSVAFAFARSLVAPIVPFNHTVHMFYLQLWSVPRSCVQVRLVVRLPMALDSAGT